MIPDREDLRNEFKSDVRKLADAELVAAVVCLANSEGGELFIGVEDDGTVTGLHADHRDVSRLAALIANRTAPPVPIRVRAFEVDDLPIAIVEVPRSDRAVATTDGRYLRRRIQLDGTPECVPLLPDEIVSRQTSLGHLDLSFRPVQGAVPADLDPVERGRLRQLIERYRGDDTLRALSDEELDKALGFVQTVDGVAVPTLTGILMIGTEDAVQRHAPTHEVAFQVRRGTDVLVNDWHRGALVRTLDRLLDRIDDQVREEELQVGLVRVPVPSFDRRALREAVVNALVHRDFTKLGPVRVLFDESGVTISNPGGFVEGVTLDNILVVEPRPRNPKLADALKRVGLTERTGRGVDLIYEGMLRYGRPAPDYERSDATTVTVHLAAASADMEFLRMLIAEEARRGTALPVESVLLLTSLRRQRRLVLADLAAVIQRPVQSARGVVEQLVDTGLLGASGEGAQRVYFLSDEVLQELGETRVEQLTADGLRQRERIVLELIDGSGAVQRADVVDACGITPRQATTLLARMVDEHLLVPVGQKRGRKYLRRQ